MEKPEKRQKAQYRSAIRSKRLIREAYVSLMQEKEADKITVSDIVRKADLNRGTFYAHYASPNYVREEISDEIVEKISEILQGFSFSHFLQDPSPFLKKVEDVLTENMKFYKEIMCYTLSIDFIGKVKTKLINRIASDSSVPDAVRKKPQFSIALDLFAGGIISLYADFVQGKIKAQPSEITNTISMLIVQSSKALFDGQEAVIS